MKEGRFKKTSAAVLLAAVVTFSSLNMVACDTSSPTTNTGSTKKPTEATSVVNDNVYDYGYAFPDPLFYSPEYRSLTQAEIDDLDNFVAYKTLGHTLTVSSAILTGTWVYHGDTVEIDGVNYHKLSYTTWDKAASADFYITDATYKNIEIVLKRSADKVSIVGDKNKGYRYVYSTPYDNNEVTVLRTSLYDELSQTPEWKAFFDKSSVKIETSEKEM